MPITQKILQLEEENRLLMKALNRMSAYSPTALYEDEDIDMLLNLLLPKDKVFVSSMLPYDLSRMNIDDLRDFIMNSYLAADKRSIVIPINILSKQKVINAQQAYQFSGMHWIVAIIYPQKGNFPANIAIFDPFGNGCGKDINLTYKGKYHKHPATANLLELGKFLKDSLNSFGVKITNSEVCLFKDVIQKNSVDCGPIVVESSRRIIGNEQRLDLRKVPLLREEQLKAIKEKIATNQRELKVLCDSKVARDQGSSQDLIQVGLYRIENPVVLACQAHSAKRDMLRNN